MQLKLKNNLSEAITVEGVYNGVLINKPLVDLSKKELKAYEGTLSEKAKEKYFLEVKEDSKDGKAKKEQPKAEDTTTGEESKDAPK